MNALICEMCGSNDLVKQDGYFVCQHCGTKYSVEEAKKLMIEGTVKIDHSDELQKLYQAARNARETSDDESALRHYENISAKDPNSWEALFFLVILRTRSITNGEITSAAISVSNCLPKVFELINETSETEEEKKEAIGIVAAECYTTADWLTNASENFYKSLTKGNGMMALTGVGGIITSATSTTNAKNENRLRCFNIANIMCTCGNCIEAYFDMNDKEYQDFATWSWQLMIQLNNEHKQRHNGNIFDDETLTRFTKKINQYDSSYEVIEKSSGGCYIATSVYGSYDCPQVWTLRRYRDNKLAKTWHGRAFIRTYYAISPSLVRYFGKTKWFKRIWTDRLNKMVEKLQRNGYESTPYDDRDW